MTSKNTFTYYLATLAILVTIVMTIVSWLKVCSEACVESHSYRLYGFTFEDIGILAFPLLLLSHLLSRRFAIFSFLTWWMLCISIGAEAMFIYIQKYQIGIWCPVCLSIASALAIAALAYLYDYVKELKNKQQPNDKGQTMNGIFKGFSGTIALVTGFLLAFGGIGKYSEIEAQESNVKSQLSFGNLDSPVDVYIFTDWECPACRSLEPTFEKIAPVIMKQAKLTFVDDPVHEATMNFTPYNLSFMINNKAKYFALRRALTALSQETKSPTQKQIVALAAEKEVRFTPLDYGDIALASKFFEQLIEEYKVEGTPTIIVANRQKNKSQKFEGVSDITEDNILKAIDKLK